MTFHLATDLSDDTHRRPPTQPSRPSRLTVHRPRDVVLLPGIAPQPTRHPLDAKDPHAHIRPIDSPLTGFHKKLTVFSCGGPFLGGFGKYRGRLLGSLFVVWAGGAAAVAAVGWALSFLGPDAWRFMLACPAAFGIATILMRAGTPESPRWLLSKGRTADAGRPLSETSASTSQGVILWAGALSAAADSPVRPGPTL